MAQRGGDYVLGTHEAEIARLALQHRVWRESMLAAWRRAGVRSGWKAIDVGAGPGNATWDLAEAVGAAGGEPNVVPAVIAALSREGFRLRSARPLIFATRPGEATWQWPASFVAVNVARLQELGRVSAEWGEAVLREMEEVEADPMNVMTTPFVLEVIAERI